MFLYFVAAICGGTGTNLDLLVVANDPDQAILLWQEGYGRNAAEQGVDEFPDKIFLVPADGIHRMLPTALGWHTDLPCVWENPNKET